MNWLVPLFILAVILLLSVARLILHVEDRLRKQRRPRQRAVQIDTKRQARPQVMDGDNFREQWKKYVSRKPVRDQSLVRRNADIILSFDQGIDGEEDVDDRVVACINEIAIAENKIDYLVAGVPDKEWRASVPKKWRLLAESLHQRFGSIMELNQDARRRESDEQSKSGSDLNVLIAKLHRQISLAEQEVHRRVLQIESLDPIPVEALFQVNTLPFYLQDIAPVQSLDSMTLTDYEIVPESEQVLLTRIQPFAPKNQGLAAASRVDWVNRKIEIVNRKIEATIEHRGKVRRALVHNRHDFESGTEFGIARRLDLLMSSMSLPKSVPKEWLIALGSGQGLVELELRLPDIDRDVVRKWVVLDDGPVDLAIDDEDELTQVSRIYPAVLLRVACEVFRLDDTGVIRKLDLSGWVANGDRADGKQGRSFVASLGVTRDDLLDFRLGLHDPRIVFEAFGGLAAGGMVRTWPASQALKIELTDGSGRQAGIVDKGKNAARLRSKQPITPHQ